MKPSSPETLSEKLQRARAKVAQKLGLAPGLGVWVMGLGGFRAWRFRVEGCGFWAFGL